MGGRERREREEREIERGREEGGRERLDTRVELIGTRAKHCKQDLKPQKNLCSIAPVIFLIISTHGIS